MLCRQQHVTAARPAADAIRFLLDLIDGSIVARESSSREGEAAVGCLARVYWLLLQDEDIRKRGRPRNGSPCQNGRTRVLN